MGMVPEKVVPFAEPVYAIKKPPFVGLSALPVSLVSSAVLVCPPGAPVPLASALAFRNCFPPVSGIIQKNVTARVMLANVLPESVEKALEPVRLHTESKKNEHKPVATVSKTESKAEHQPLAPVLPTTVKPAIKPDKPLSTAPAKALGKITHSAAALSVSTVTAIARPPDITHPHSVTQQATAAKPKKAEVPLSAETAQPRIHPTSVPHPDATPSHTSLIPEEEQPLEQWEKQHQASTSPVTSFRWERWIASILLVLALLWLFAKTVLPALLKRFPVLLGTPQEAGKKPDRSISPLPQAQGTGSLFGFFQQARQKAPLGQQLSNNKEQFQVRSMIHLAEGTDLYLVEVQDRQLVIAVTPHSVSLVHDLSAGQATAKHLDDMVQSGLATLFSKKTKLDVANFYGKMEWHRSSDKSRTRSLRFMVSSSRSKRSMLKQNQSLHELPKSDSNADGDHHEASLSAPTDNENQPTAYQKYLPKNIELGANVDLVFLDDYDDSYQSSQDKL
jgi:flagellar biogenesis protein FliO